jgi:alpha-tubulin suppressor-like RCC1 family protein
MTIQHMLLALGGFIEEFALPEFGSAFSWGSNGSGRLGNNSTLDQSSPVSVTGGFVNWSEISGGGSHSLGVRNDGTAYAWGDNSLGQLGDNTTVSRSSPRLISGGFTDWIQVSTGFQHSLGLRANGTAWAWGSSVDGQVGHNSTTSRSSPTLVAGDFTDWVQVSATSNASLGLRENGTAWAWGSGNQGRNGNNSTLNQSSPVSVIGGFTDWTQLSAGALHSLGVRENGTAWAWGWNSSGQLGDGATTAKSSPVSVIGGFTDWTQLSAGTQHSLGIRENGTAWAWGNNNSGHLGDDTTAGKSSPVSVVGGFTDWIQVSASLQHSLGLRANGTAWAWGNGTNGRLGNNSITNRSSPVSVVGGDAIWIRVSGGNYHSLGLK